MLGISKHKAVYRIFKSERINAIRKQYDAFLEEDKKRKERNEYILGRLDRMRQSTSLVPVRQKHNPLRNWISAVSAQKYPEDFGGTRDLRIPVNRHQSLQDNALQNIDTYLVQEISKNYILIPKLRSMNPHVKQELSFVDPVTYAPGVQQNTLDNINEKSSNDNNWQSKYEILNILKNEEKDIKTIESATNKQKESRFSLKNGILLNNNDEKNNSNNNIDTHTDNIAGTEYKYLEELPEKDMSGEKVRNYEVKQSEPSNDNKTVPNNSLIDNIAKADEFPEHNIEVDNINHQLQNVNLQYDKSQDQDPTDNQNYAGHDGYAHAVEKIHNYHGEYTPDADQCEPVYNKDEKIQNIEIYEKGQGEISHKLTEESNNQFKSVNSVGAEDRDENIYEEVKDSHLINESNHINVPVQELTDSVHHMKENINVEKTTPNLEHQISDLHEITDSKQQAIDQVGVIDNDDIPINDFTDLKDTLVEKEELFDDTELHAFDTEQREMFYVEQPGETQLYEQEQNRDEQGYPINEGETLNQEYTHYDNIQSEAHPVDNTEFDAVTLRYDTAYQQQYVNSYENTYEDEPEQIEIEKNYDPIPPEDMQLLYDQQNTAEELQPIYDQQDKYTPEQIESTLNAEEGYSEQTQEYLVKPQLPSDVETKLT